MRARLCCRASVCVCVCVCVCNGMVLTHKHAHSLIGMRSQTIPTYHCPLYQVWIPQRQRRNNTQRWSALFFPHVLCPIFIVALHPHPTNTCTGLCLCRATFLQQADNGMVCLFTDRVTCCVCRYRYRLLPTQWTRSLPDSNAKGPAVLPRTSPSP